MRRRGAHEHLAEPLDEEAEVLAFSDSAADEARRDLHKLLADLPDRHRLPIVYTRLDGLSVKEAAQAAGMSEAAVKVGVHRGLMALAKKIRGSG